MFQSMFQCSNQCLNVIYKHSISTTFTNKSFDHHCIIIEPFNAMNADQDTFNDDAIDFHIKSSEKTLAQLTSELLLLETMELLLLVLIDLVMVQSASDNLYSLDVDWNCMMENAIYCCSVLMAIIKYQRNKKLIL